MKRAGRPPMKPMIARKTRSPPVPSHIKGRRRPILDCQRSLMAPESGWISIARISPPKVSSPSQVFFWVSGTYLSNTAGKMVTCRLFHMKERPIQYALSTKIYQPLTCFFMLSPLCGLLRFNVLVEKAKDCLQIEFRVDQVHL